MSDFEPRRSCEPLNDLDELVVGGAGRLAEFIDRVLVGKPTQAQQFTRALSPI